MLTDEKEETLELSILQEGEYMSLCRRIEER